MHNFDNVDVIKFTTELANLGVTWDRCDVISDTSVQIEFTDGTDMQLVQQIIDAHEPKPMPPVPSETEKLRLEMARSNAEMFEMMVSMMGGGM